jgi:hypothetical protein
LLASTVLNAAEIFSPTEYQVKAAFLYHFVRFVEWPSKAFQGPRAPLVLCILGDDPFGPDLEDAISGKTIGERSLFAKRIRRIQDTGACHVVFVSSSERERLGQVMAYLRHLSILTVGETDRFLQLGGMINFILEEGKVRFEINVDAGERSNLKLSSKLLKVARIVRERPGN